MPLILPHSVFLMIPRAASTWCRQAIRSAQIPYKEFGPKHGTVLPPNAPAFRFCLTREPRAWVRSRWTLGKWEDDLSELWSIDREKFDGLVTDGMVGMYFAKWVNLCKANGFVGTAENAAEDLVTALRMAGEDFDETSLRETPRINESPPNGDLIDAALWAMKRDDLGKLPADHIGRLSEQLIQRLPADALEKLPANVLAAMVKRTSLTALQAGGAGTMNR